MKPDAMERSEYKCNRGCGDSVEMKGNRWRKKDDAPCYDLTSQVAISRRKKVDANPMYETCWSTSTCTYQREDKIISQGARAPSSPGKCPYAKHYGWMWQITNMSQETSQQGVIIKSENGIFSWGKTKRGPDTNQYEKVRGKDHVKGGSDSLWVTTSGGNLLPNKDKPWKESRSRVWTRIKGFPTCLSRLEWSLKWSVSANLLLQNKTITSSKWLK